MENNNTIKYRTNTNNTYKNNSNTSNASNISSVRNVSNIQYMQKKYKNETSNDTNSSLSNIYEKENDDYTSNDDIEDEIYNLTDETNYQQKNQNVIKNETGYRDILKGKNNISTYYEKEKLYNKKNANANEKKISYIKKGSGPSIILVPGYSMTQDMWPTPFINMLATQYTVVTYDLRGVGDSKDTGEEHSLVLYADDLSRLIKQLGIQKATIMGWSMGANICQEFALKYSNQLNKLILYAGDAGPYTDIKVSREAVYNLLNTHGTPAEREMRYLKLIFPEKWLSQHMSKIKDYIPLQKTIISPEIIWKQWNAIYSWKGSLDRLSKITCTTLILVGAMDVLPNALNSNLLAQHIHNSWLIQFPDAGNGLIYQYSGKVAETIICFLKAS
jgi:pimeloyl-ACP methyl ester carboxylesterase